MGITYDNIASKICDCHVHYGQFRDDYYSIDKVVDFFEILGIDNVGIMPTAMNGKINFNDNLKEIKQLPTNRFIPYLWLTPEMYELDSTLKMYDELNFKIIKIHGYANKEWVNLPDKIQNIIDLAYKRDLPIMFHTGGWEGSESIQYLDFCVNNPEVKFILAHGKPIEEAITILKMANNVYVDTSFLDLSSVQLLCDEGLEKKILYGTDFPIMKTFWPEIDLVTWYKQNVMEYINTFGEKNFMVWSNENFYKLILK
ncbi:MAG: amidohydrolase family protein [Paludibacter sp.]